MPINLEEYQRLKKAADDAARSAARAAGALDHAMAELRDVYHCQTIEEGEALLVKYEAEAQELEAAYYAELEKYKQEWGEYLKDE